MLMLIACGFQLLSLKISPQLLSQNGNTNLIRHSTPTRLLLHEGHEWDPGIQTAYTEQLLPNVICCGSVKVRSWNSKRENKGLHSVKLETHFSTHLINFTLQSQVWWKAILPPGFSQLTDKELAEFDSRKYPFIWCKPSIFRKFNF